MKKHPTLISWRHWRWIPALTLSLLTITPHQAARAEGDFETTQSSKLLNIALPSTAARSTNLVEVGKFASALGTIAGANNGKISATEVLVWEKSAQPLVKFPAVLRAANYKYLPQLGSEWPNLGQVTPFGLESADQSRQFVGLWIEQGEYIILAWGRFQSEATPETPAKSAPDLTSLADKLTQAPPRAATNASIFRVADANDVARDIPTPKLPTFSKITSQPKTVRGQVKDGAGKPIVGAQIVTQTSYAGGFRTDNRAKTNAQGIYQVQLPGRIAQVVNADCVVRYNGKRYLLPLNPADGECDEFDSSQGHIENFVLRTFGMADPIAENHLEWGSRYYGGSLRLVRFDDIPTGGTFQITLTPQGPLLDGSKGRTLDLRIPNKGQGEIFINDIPLGRYEMKAQIVDGNNQPLHLKKIYGDDEYADTLTVDFQPKDGDLANLGQSGVERLDIRLGP